MDFPEGTLTIGGDLKVRRLRFWRDAPGPAAESGDRPRTRMKRSACCGARWNSA